MKIHELKLKTNWNMIKTRKGFSLVEILVTMGIMGIALTGMLVMQDTEIKRIRYNRLIASRDTLKMTMDRYILDAKIVNHSALQNVYQDQPNNINGNIALNYCMYGAPGSPTPQCSGADHPNNCCKAVTGQPFLLLDPSDLSNLTVFSGTDVNPNPAMASTENAPARYNLDGSRCRTVSEQCILELVTNYTAICGSGLSSCAQADQIYVSYSLRQAPDVHPIGGTPLKSVSPSSPILIMKAVTPSSDNGPITFTRFTTNALAIVGSDGSPTSPTIAEIDTLCKNEFGTNFKAASETECKMFSQTGVCKTAFYANVDEETGARRVRCISGCTSGHYYKSACVPTMTQPIARTTAVYTRTSATVPSVAQIDTFCSNEFGPNYRSASVEECDSHSISTEGCHLTIFSTVHTDHGFPVQETSATNGWGKYSPIGCIKKN